MLPNFPTPVCQSLQLEVRSQLEQTREELKDKQEVWSRQQRETAQLNKQLKAAQVCMYVCIPSSVPEWRYCQAGAIAFLAKWLACIVGC